MFCKKCGGNDSGTFNGEMSIRFGGFEGLNKPIILVYSNIDVCLTCGLAALKVPERELAVLREGRYIEGALVVGS